MSDLRVEILRDPDRILDARRLQGERYLTSGFVDHLDDGVVADPWVDVSTYFGAIDADGRVTGVARLIPPNIAGLPALDNFELTPAGSDYVESIVPQKIVEVSALAVAKGQGVFRSGQVASALYRAMYQYSVVTAGHTHWCAALDVRVKLHLMRSYNFLFEDLGGAQSYLGSPTVPVMLDLLGQARHFAFTAPERNDYFLAGLVIDLRDSEVRLTAGSGEYLPAGGIHIPG